MFGDHAGAEAWIAADWLLPAALVTLVVGSIGTLGAKGMTRLIAFSVIASMGTLLTAVALSTPAATTAALFYLIHSVFAAAALFLISDKIAARRGNVGEQLVVVPLITLGSASCRERGGLPVYIYVVVRYSNTKTRQKTTTHCTTLHLP